MNAEQVAEKLNADGRMIAKVWKNRVYVTYDGSQYGYVEVLDSGDISCNHVQRAGMIKKILREESAQ